MNVSSYDVTNIIKYEITINFKSIMIEKDGLITFYHNIINMYSGPKAINMKNF